MVAEMVDQFEEMMGVGTMSGHVVKRGLLALLVCGGLLSAGADEAEGDASPRMGVIHEIVERV